ncbi:MAG: 16S rRNA (cytidine(1402)-2'-O)-methyltransferase [Armatimonadota bacterium]|nr:16S rRNA (cytidine(1402)-2'-O)-methyltransferase [Armatimonadota bacterium]
MEQSGKQSPGTLYVVATPIGNLADITLRALAILKEVDLIAAEDTRVTQKLLSRYGIDTPTTPYHQHSLGKKAERLTELLKEGKNIALVSDAGTPGISDPGCEIINLAIKNEVPVVAIPGPNAIITALVVSGLPTRRFAFDGFPPRKSGERRTFFTSLKDERRTMVFYESPNRLLPTLKEMLDVFGDRRIAVVREATKKFEEVHRGTISSAIARFTEVKAKGEITIVVAGCAEGQTGEAGKVEEELRCLLAEGMSERDAVRELALKFPLPKKEIYRRMIQVKKELSGDQN